MTLWKGFPDNDYIGAWIDVFCSPSWLFEGATEPCSSSYERDRGRRGERCPRRRADHYGVAMRSAIGAVTMDATTVLDAG